MDGGGAGEAGAGGEAGEMRSASCDGLDTQSKSSADLLNDDSSKISRKYVPQCYSIPCPCNI